MDISDPVVGAEGIRDVLGEISMGDFKGRKTVPHSEMKEKRRGRVKMAKRALAVGGVLGIVGAGIWGVCRAEQRGRVLVGERRDLELHLQEGA